LFGTIRNSDIIALVVDAAEPLEGAELLITLLESRGVILRSVTHDQLDPVNFNEHSTLLVVNRIDAAPAENLDILREFYGQKLDIMPVSAQTAEGLPELIARFWQMLSMIRVYTKQPGKPADRDK